MNTYSAKDFSKVCPHLKAIMPRDPQTLIHRRVRESDLDENLKRERGAAVYIADIPSKRYSVTFSEIAPHKVKRNHRHTYDAIMVIEKGSGYSIVEGCRIDWDAGDVLLIPVWAWHQHFNPNLDLVRYLTFENAPELLNNGTAIREEEADLSDNPSQLHLATFMSLS